MTDITTPTPTSPNPADQSSASPTERASDVASTAVEHASGVAGTAADQAKTVAATAVDEAKAVGAHAASEAKDLFADARQQLRAQASEQSDRLAQSVRQLSEQLRSMADAGDGIASDVVSQLADQAQGFSSRLTDGGLDRAMQDARRLARNRPGMFLLGAAAAGFMAARVARNVDTHALADAAKPDQDSNRNGQAALGQPSAPSDRDRPLRAQPAPDVEPITTAALQPQPGVQPERPRTQGTSTSSEMPGAPS